MPTLPLLGSPHHPGKRPQTYPSCTDTRPKLHYAIGDKQDFMKFLSPALHAIGGRQQKKVE